MIFAEVLSKIPKKSFKLPKKVTVQLSSSLVHNIASNPLNSLFFHRHNSHCLLQNHFQPSQIHDCDLTSTNFLTLHKDCNNELYPQHVGSVQVHFCNRAKTFKPKAGPRDMKGGSGSACPTPINFAACSKFALAHPLAQGSFTMGRQIGW